MARTATTKSTTAKSSTSKTIKPVETDTTAAVDVVNEKEILSKENADLKEQLALLMATVAEMKAEMKAGADSSKETQSNFYEAEMDTLVDIADTKQIMVMSLSDGEVYLHNGMGQTFPFDRFGAKRAILYRDLLGIISYDRKFIEEGVVYICDEEVVHNNYLEDAYSKFLTPKTIQNILSFSIDEITEMISKTTEPIQETIISQLVERINKNEYVDMNKLVAIGNAVKKKCDIQALALSMRNK